MKKINDLYKFMEDVAVGLKNEVKKGDLEALKFVLGLIHQVRVRQTETLEMFEPLIKTVKFFNSPEKTRSKVVFGKLNTSGYFRRKIVFS